MSGELVYRLGDLQLRILQVLWQDGPSSVASVQRALADHLAYTTVATMLRKMELRGLVSHQESGRRYIYSAAVPRERVAHGIADRLVDRLFNGSLTGAVNHLLETRDVNPDELDDLQELIRHYRSRRQ